MRSIAQVHRERLRAERRHGSSIPFLLILLLAPALASHDALAQGFGGTVEDLLVRGDALLAQKRPNEAAVQYQEVRTLCPDPVQAVSSYIGEAKARMDLGDYLPASGLLEEAVETYPDDPRVADMLYRAGFARQRAGDEVGAAPLLRRALEHDPPGDILPAIKLRLAKALRLTGEPQQVVDLLADFEKSFPGNPQIPNALYTLAIAQHDAGKLKDSEATYRRIIKGFPGSSAAVEGTYELGIVLAELGQRDEAVKRFRDYVDLDPNSPLAAKALERAADLLLFRAPSQSAELYGLAAVKAKTNPKPDAPSLSISRWFGWKRRLAGFLSRTWIVIAIVVVVPGMGALLAWRLARRRPREAAG